MVNITNVAVTGIEESIVASNYAMRTDFEDHNIFEESSHITKERMKRVESLGSAPTGSGHDSYLKGCIVQFNIKYPNYFTPELQRYTFLNIITSSSKMHRLLSPKLEIFPSCNKYVKERALEVTKLYKNIYNVIIDNKLLNKSENETVTTVESGGKFLIGKDDIIVGYMGYNNVDGKLVPVTNLSNGDLQYASENPNEVIEISSYEAFMIALSNLPSGFEQTMRCTTNYLQLKTIFLQRRNHKLKEDWGPFCDWILSLPHFKELCLKNVKL